MNVARFTIRKLAGALVTLLLAVTFAFLISRLAGDATVQLVGPLATADELAAQRARLGLDRPLLSQYLTFISDLGHGDLGQSLRYNRANTELIAVRLGPSAQLVGVAMGISVLLGLPLGVLGGWKEGKLADRAATTVSLIGQSVPTFWLGLVLTLVFAVWLRWLPAGQSGSWQHLVLPGVTLSTIPLARVARLTRSSVVEALGEPYIVAARARGLGEGRILTFHVLRNACLPVITLIGQTAGVLLSGAVIVEFVFAWPGLGSLATQAVQFRDTSLAQALVVLGAAVFVAINLAVDLIYAIVDPRIRESQS